MNQPNPSHPSSDDQAIETLLTALRATTPPVGLEDRVLASLHARARTTPRRIPGRVPAFAAVAMAACALIVAVFFAITHHHSVKDTTPDFAETQPHIAPSPEQSQLRPARTHAHTVLVTAAPARVASDQATDNTRAASFPTPPLPLTDQERMLLQIANHRNPANVAALNPAQQEIQIAQETAQFQDFFSHPPLKANEPDSSPANLQPETMRSAQPISNPTTETAPTQEGAKP